MTVSTATRRVTYAGDGISQVFPVPFKFLANGDLKLRRVTAAGVETALTLDSDYTVTGALAESGGTVTMVTAPATGERLLIKREVTRLQPLDMTPFDPFPAEAQERALDLLTMAVQEDSDNLTRALVVPEADPQVGNLTLPPAASRVGQLLGFGSDGVPTLYSPGEATNASVVPYTAPTSTRVRTVAAVIDDRVHLEDYAVLDAVAQTDGSITGTSASAGLALAIARLNSRGGGTLVVDGPARLTVAQGLASNTEVHLTPRGTLWGDLPLPSGDKMHEQTSVLYASGIEVDASYATFPGATGDYMISSPRPFAANQTIKQGDSSFTALNASDLSDVTPGSWLQISMAYPGWHALVQEYVKVQSITGGGTVCNFMRPCRFQYDNLNNGLADFVKTFKWAANAPGGANGVSRSSWPRAGFRRVVPVESVAITGEGRIVNLRDRAVNGLANFALFFWAAIGCRVERGVKLRGGSVWMLDCQDMMADFSSGPTYATSSTPNNSFYMNGSNNVQVDGGNYTRGGIIVEEYALNVGIMNTIVDGAIIAVQAGCRRVTLDNVAVANPVGPPAINYGSGNFEFGNQDVVLNRVRGMAQGSGIGSYGLPLLDAQPSIKPAMIAAVAPYYDGQQLITHDCEFSSVANDGFDVLAFQPFRAENTRVGTPTTNGGISKDAISPNNGRVIGRGLLRKNGFRTGVASAAALPTFMPAEVGDIVMKADGTGKYECVNFRQTTIASQISTIILQLDNILNDGSVAVNDVAEILISNGSFVVNVPASFTTGSAVVTQTVTAGMAAGMAVTGQWAAKGATVATIDSATQFTMSVPCTLTGGSVTAARGNNVTVGNIVKIHTVTLTAVNTGTGEITFTGQAIPAGYSAVTAAGGYVRLGRWA